MARKVTESRITEVKEPAEPTLESRVSGLEYRAAHPNHRSLDAMLANPVDAHRFRTEFDRCCFAKDVLIWGDGRTWPLADSASTAISAESAESAPITAAIIWGALLGAALALAVLAICNPAAFHWPAVSREIVVGEGSRSVPAPTVPAAVQTVTTATTACSGCVTTTGDPSTTEENAIVHGIDAAIIVDDPCWVSVTNAHGKVLAEKTLEPGKKMMFQKLLDPPFTVRAGCPGKIHYAVDGQYVFPENHSQKPEKSEVVTIP